MGIRLKQMKGLSPRGIELVKGLRTELYNEYKGPWNGLPLIRYFESNIDFKLICLKRLLDDCEGVMIPFNIQKQYMTPLNKWLDELVLNEKKEYKYKEVAQAESWSSGPCIFLCLEDMDGNRYGEWLEDEIEKEL